MPDDYQYPVKPLPVVAPWGGNPFSNSNIPFGGGISGGVPYPTASAIQANGPFGEPSVNGGGGGGGGAPTCATSWDIGSLNISTLSLPCSSPVSLIAANVISLVDSGTGNTLELSAVNGRIVLSTSGKTVSIDVADLPGGSTAQFREFVNCNGQTWYALSTEVS